MDVKEFLNWYGEAYSLCDINSANARECAAFLTGLMAAHKPVVREDGTVFDPTSAQLTRCVGVLTGAANVIDALKRKAV